MGKLSVTFVACVVGSAAIVSAARAGKVTTNAASVTFSDRTVATAGVQDRVTSDGLGPYADGSGGVSCVIFTGSTGDAHCDLSSSRNPVRVFNVDPSQQISGTGPTAPLSSNGSFNFEALATMHIGDAKLTTAVFSTAIGQFQFVNRLNPQTSSVSVTRLDDHIWTVTTSDPYSLGAGDVAQLLQVGKGGKTTNVGYYHLPFEVTVSCATCVAPLP